LFVKMRSEEDNIDDTEYVTCLPPKLISARETLKPIAHFYSQRVSKQFPR